MSNTEHQELRVIDLPSISGSSLPIEIIDIILKLVGSENVRDLHTCRLVCTMFDQLYLSALFREAMELGPCLSQSCSTSSSIVLGAIQRYPDLKARLSSISFTTSLRTTHSTLCEVPEIERSPLLQLPNVCKIVVSAKRRNSFEYFSSFPGSVTSRHLVEAYLHTGILTNITINNIHNLPIVTILSSHSLVTLRLQKCHFQVDPRRKLDTTREPIGCNLEYLIVRHADVFPAQILQHLSKLRRLVVTDIRAVDDYDQYLGHTPNSLQYLVDLDVSDLLGWENFRSENGVTCSSVDTLRFAAYRDRFKANFAVLERFKTVTNLTLAKVGVQATDSHDNNNVDQNLYHDLAEYVLKFTETLRSLSFEWSQCDPDGQWPFLWQLGQIHKALERVAGNNTIRQIDFSITHIQGGRKPEIFVMSTEMSNLRQLSQLLCDERAFPRLRKASFLLVVEALTRPYNRFWTRFKRPQELIYSGILPAFSSLIESKTIDFKFIVKVRPVSSYTKS